MNNMGFATSFGLNVRSEKDLKNVFGDESDGSDEKREAPKDIVRFQLEQQRKRIEAEMKLKSAEATKVDPTALEYDEVYDSMKKEDIKYQEKKQLKQSIRGKPKYVDKLIKEAEKRKLQNDLWYERKLQREQAVESATYGDTEKFVTSSYKKHLEEVKKFEEEQRLEEERNAVTGKAGMRGFYSNMLGFDEPSTKKQKPEEKVVPPSTISAAPVSSAPVSSAPVSAVPAPAAPVSSSVEEPKKSTVLNLSSAVGVKDDGGEARRKELEELNQTRLNKEKIEAAKLRMLQRKQQQQQQQQH
jgi:coiled-coil domain-containing protein 55